MWRVWLVLTLHFFSTFNPVFGYAQFQRHLVQEEVPVVVDSEDLDEAPGPELDVQNQNVRTEPVLVDSNMSVEPVLTGVPSSNALEDLFMSDEDLPPSTEANLTVQIGSFQEGKSAEFFGEVDPTSFCKCTDTVPEDVFSCQEVRFEGDCDSEEFKNTTQFCRVTCDRCECCPSLLSMAPRRGLDTFWLAAHRLAQLEGVRSVANALADPSFVGTVFVPTNDAFARFFVLLNITKEEFLNQPRLLNQILTYHVLVGPVLATFQELLEGSLGGSLLTQNVASFLALESERDSLIIQGIGSRTQIVVPDLHSCRGLMHVVKDLLIPFSTNGFWE